MGGSQALGGYLVTPDYEPYDPGISMAEVLALANRSRVSDVIITLDCCHSGAFGNVPAVGDEKIVLRDGVTVVTATRAQQMAAGTDQGGVFTSLLVEALEGGAASIAGDVTAASVYAYLDGVLGAWGQRPMFKASVYRFVRLRTAAPRIRPEVLRKLVTYFKTPDYRFPLSPEYELEAEPRNPDKEAVFRDLMQLRDAGLVQPIGEDYLYYAAIHSKACGLTVMGRSYWRLVKEGRV